MLLVSYIIYILLHVMCQVSYVFNLFQIQIDIANGLNQVFLSYRKFEDHFSIIHLFLFFFKICKYK